MNNLINTCLFLTKGQSLKDWDKNGILDRELNIYRNLIKLKKIKLTIISYAQEDEFKLLNNIEDRNINIIYNKNKLSNFFYLISIIFLKFSYFNKIKIFKSNQERGALWALIYSKIFFSKFIFRSGYSLRHHIKKKYGRISFEYLYAYINNFLCSYFSSAIVITSKNFINYYCKKKKITIIQNYLPDYLENYVFSRQKKIYDFIYIGRLSKEKNYKFIYDLAKKIKKLNILIISNDKDNFQLDIKNIRYLNNIKNTEIYEYLIKSKFLLLPSHYEGQSKVMLEAIHCEVPVFAKNSIGINKVISHKQNGFLFEKLEDLIEIFDTAEKDNNLLKTIKYNAKKQISNQHLLSKIIKKEINLLELLND